MESGHDSQKVATQHNMEVLQNEHLDIKRIDQIRNSYLSSGRIPMISSVRQPSNVSFKYEAFLKISEINTSTIPTELSQASVDKSTSASNITQVSLKEPVKNSSLILLNKASETSGWQSLLGDLPKPINTADDWNMFKDLGDAWSWKVYDEASKLIDKEGVDEGTVTSPSIR